MRAKEHYKEDDNITTVSISAHNMTLQPQEYRIDNESGLVMCQPQFDSESVPEFLPRLTGLSVMGVTLLIGVPVVYLLVFALTPSLRTLSSMNLASLSVSLLVMYCSTFVGYSIGNSGVPCVVLAIITHYTLLVSFCWMLTIAYDINRVLRQTTTELLLTAGKHWRKFGFYSLWSWTCPAVVVGAALAFDFYTDQVSEFLRPAYGEKDCYISKATALLVFTFGPLFVIMVLNAIFFMWSAYLIHTTRSDLSNATATHKIFSLYALLALIWGLTWAVGLIAGFVDSLEVCDVFAILYNLQGFYIFLAFFY